jgi:hypothetical protein
MYASLEERSVIGSSCGNWRIWIRGFWGYMPAHVRRVCDDVRVLLLSAPGPE